MERAAGEPGSVSDPDSGSPNQATATAPATANTKPRMATQAKPGREASPSHSTPRRPGTTVSPTTRAAVAPFTEPICRATVCRYIPPMPATRIAYKAGSLSSDGRWKGAAPFRTRTPTPSAPKPRPESRPARIAARPPSIRTITVPPPMSTIDATSSHQCVAIGVWPVPSGPAAVASSTNAEQTTAMEAHSARVSRMPRSLTLNTAVITRLALITVWDRNSGSSRAASAPSPKPMKSSTVPTMNSQVTAAFAVEERLGPPCWVTPAVEALAASWRADLREPTACRTEPVP